MQVGVVKETPDYLEYTNAAVKNNGVIVLDAVAEKGLVLQYASAALRDDRIVVQAAVNQTSSSLKFASDTLQEFIVQLDPAKLQYAREHIQKARIEINPRMLQCASKTIQSDKDIVLSAFRKNGSVLQYASIALQQESIAENLNNLQYVSDCVQKKIIEKDLTNIQYASYDMQVGLVATNTMKLQYSNADIKNNRVIVLDAVKKNGLVLAFASKTLQDDIEVVKSAVKQNNSVLQYASFARQREIIGKHPTWLQHASFALAIELIESNWRNLGYAGISVRNNRKVVLNAVAQNIDAIAFASDEIKADAEIKEGIKEFKSAAAKHRWIITYNDHVVLPLTKKEAAQDILVALASLPNQKSHEDKLHIIYAALARVYVVTNLTQRVIAKVACAVPTVFSPMPFDYLLDISLLPLLSSQEGLKSFVREQLQVLICRGIAPSHGGIDDFRAKFLKALRTNHELKKNVTKVLNVQFTASESFSIEVLVGEVEKLDGEEFMLLLVELEPDNLFSLKSTILSSNNNDIQTVLYAVKQDVGALQYASDQIQKNLVESDPMKLKYVSDRIQRDLVEYDPINLRYASKTIQDNKDLVLYAVTKNGWLVYYVSANLLNDKSVVLAAVKQKGRALIFVSKALQDDRDVVLAAVRQDGLALQNASPTLRNDKKIVLIAISNNSKALEFASDNLKQDKQMVLLAMIKDSRALDLAGNLKHDPEFKEEAKAFKVAISKYKYAANNKKSITLPLTKKEALKDALIRVLSLPKQKSSKNKLQIIFLARTKPYLVTSLAWCMKTMLQYKTQSGNKMTMPENDSASLLARDLAPKGKINFSINVFLLQKLSSESGVKEFAQESWQSIIDEGMAQRYGGSSIFRDKFIESIETDDKLSNELRDIMVMKYESDNPCRVMPNIRDMNNTQLMSFLSKLHPNDLYKIMKAHILIEQQNQHRVECDLAAFI